MMYRSLIVAVMVALAAGSASGQVFSLINQSVSNITGTGARAHGMGGAFIALADDATAASWNPAGLSQLSRPEVSVVYEDFGGSYDLTQHVIQDWSAYEPFPFSIVSDVQLPGDFSDSNVAFASATYPFRIGKRTLVTQVSYRRMASFPDLKRTGSSMAELLDASGTALADIQTTISSDDQFSGGIDAYSISFATQLGTSVRLGLSANYMDVDLGNHYVSREVQVDLPDVCWSCVSVDARESFSDWNFDIGLQWQPVTPLTLGAVYHSGFAASYDYASTVGRTFYDVDSERVITLPASSSSGTTTVHFPDGWGVGLAWRPTDRLTFAVDYSEMSWSEGRVEEYGAPGWRPDGTPVVRPPREIGFPFSVDQEDSYTARGGAEYVFMFASGLIIPVRAGYFQEKQFAAFSEFAGVSNPPVFDGYTLGTGFAFKSFQLDFAWVHTTGEDSRTESYSYQDSIGGVDVEVGVEEDRHVDYTSDRFLVSAIVRF